MTTYCYYYSYYYYHYYYNDNNNYYYYYCSPSAKCARPSSEYKHMHHLLQTAQKPSAMHHCARLERLCERAGCQGNA